MKYKFIDGLSPAERKELERSQRIKEEAFEGLRQYDKDKNLLYNLTVEGHTKAQTVESDFSIKILNELTFLEHNKNEGLWRFRLKELSYNLDKYNDPVIVQVVEMSNLISGIYQELDFWVNSVGELQKINNRGQIMKRWEKVRETLSYKHPLSSYEVIMAKEREMANKDLELLNIRFIHFIHFYFFQFGRFKPQEHFTVVDMDRFGSGVQFSVAVDGIRKDEENKIHRHFSGNLNCDFKTIKAMSKAVKEDYADVTYKTRADYYSTGMVIENAHFSFDERIGKSYSMYSNLHLELIDNG